MPGSNPGQTFEEAAKQMRLQLILGIVGNIAGPTFAQMTGMAAAEHDGNLDQITADEWNEIRQVSTLAWAQGGGGGTGGMGTPPTTPVPPGTPFQDPVSYRSGWTNGNVAGNWQGFQSGYGYGYPNGFNAGYSYTAPAYSSGFAQGTGYGWAAGTSWNRPAYNTGYATGYNHGAYNTAYGYGGYGSYGGNYNRTYYGASMWRV
ncbi:MAG: hypothetical protein SFZ03_04380 [Candidatus Melainabacteria bacterium]|nr:hypothetical protein [Candidatus Melainabacteria bacterium]